VNNQTISLKGMGKCIRRNIVFLTIWIFVIFIIFSISSLKVEAEHTASYKYRFPKDDITQDPIIQVANTLQSAQIFSQNFRLLKQISSEQDLNNEFTLKKNARNKNINISLTRKDSLYLKDDITAFVCKIDSIFIKQKLLQIEENILHITKQIEDTELIENEFKRVTIYNNLNRALEQQILREYYYENLPERIIDSIIIKDNSISRIMIYLGVVIFAIWSGLMIIIIKFFLKK
jgi:cell division protein FtsL